MLEHYPYHYTYNVGNPARNLHAQSRYLWLLDHVGPTNSQWTWRLGPDLELIFYFKTRETHAQFVLTWG